MRFLFVFLFCLPLYAQQAVSKHLIISPFYKGKIALYDKPGGKVTGTFTIGDDEDYPGFTVEKEKEGWFYGTFAYSISDKEGKGWIKKESYLGIYTRNYEEGHVLNLYTKPDAASKIQSSIPDRFDIFCTVKEVSGEWVYVETEYDGLKKEGWLSPDMQCDNPYTTCN